MKLIVFGANGGVGKEVVTQALAAGHKVVAITHSSASTNGSLPHLTYLLGSIDDAVFVRRALQNCDAVISTIGTVHYKQPVSLYSTAAETLLPIMREYGPKRLIVLSAGGATIESNDPLIFKLSIKPLLQRIFRNLYFDMLHMERLIEASDLNWTIMRLSYLRNKPGKGKYRINYDAAVRYGQSINRADVAHYIVHHLQDPASYKKHVSIAY